ncbi:VWA domain-containing protein [Endozoicomonas ascidiicola]|uniref:VWA domain-containing protein n=1 Tax=Endozoicomonas ascidiicola TaxID=1698521 RepID=UPI00082C2D9E|nr:VWA domain-containing protein [Endozoicomonas ascidiicola]USN26998.1 VWA domain-containing protein [synthetic construct]
MRRLPVYLVIDVSTSMTGEPIEAVRNGMDTLLSSLRQDPHALETAALSVIEFGSDAKQSVPLTELINFQVPTIEANGWTAMGAALSLLNARVTEEVKKTTADSRGDWKPLVFLFTDGIPTDDLQKGLADLDKSKLGMIVACAAGPHADVDELKKITDCVVRLDTLDSAGVAAFFKWVSASVSTSSVKIDLTKKEVSTLDELPPPPEEVKIVF